MIQAQLSPRRRALDLAFLALTGGAAAFGLLVLVVIFLIVVSSGAPAISLEFLSSDMRESGAAGGILYQIVGTAILAGSAVLIATPLSLGTALTLSEYVPSRSLRRFANTMLYLLNGVPSIIFGVVGYYTLVRAAGFDKSWLVGGLVLAFMILPTVTISVNEAIQRIPKDHRDAAHALGLNPPKVIWSVVLPYSLRGLVTGILLGLARAAGETAPIMFTAAVFSGADLPDGVVDNPVLAIPYHILNLAQDASSPEILTNAWGSALVLLALSLLLSTLGWLVRERAGDQHS